MNVEHPNIRASERIGFTLVELMVAIALVVILMYGVTKVFSTTQSVVSANQAISTATRDARAAQSVLARDFANAVTNDAPFMYIFSTIQPAFRNKTDMDGDRDALPLTFDADGDNQEGTGPGETIRPANYNFRNHRVDRLSFFERGLFHRTTGGTVASNGASPFISDMTTTESWVWFGHLRIPNNAGSVTVNQDPGAGSLAVNQNNFFATDWILGREQFLLKEKSAQGPGGEIRDKNNQPQIFIDGMNPIPNAGVPDLQPLQYQSGANVTAGNGGAENNTSRFDLAATSLSEFRNRLSIWIRRDTGPAPVGNQWYSEMFGSKGRRFQTNPFLGKPVTPATLSQQSPIFLRGCTQFIVEYAADYLDQDGDPGSPTYGQVKNAYFSIDPATAPATDGKVDFVIQWNDQNGNNLIDATERASIRKSVRWYGLPRDTSGDGAIPGWTAGRLPNLMPDVVPLRDIIRSGSSSSVPGMSGSLKTAMAACVGAPFEKDMLNFPTATGTGSTGLPADYLAASGGLQGDDEYICAWGPSDQRPQMVRLTFVLDDALGRTPDGQTFEYVFSLP